MNRLILLLLTAMGIALLYLTLRSVARLFENGGPSADFDQPDNHRHSSSQKPGSRL